jgi:hypothetical protein
MFDTVVVTQISYISIKINYKEFFVRNDLFNDLFFPNCDWRRRCY